MNESPLTSLKATITSVQALFDQLENGGVFIGGVAASVLGKPRMTADVDGVILIDDEEIADVINLAKGVNLEMRIPDAGTFARRSRVLLLQDSRNDIAVDLALGLLPFEYDTVENSRIVEIEDIRVKMPTREDLVIMKAIAGRPKDLEDIRGLLQVASDFDLDYVWERVEGWAMMMERPEIAETYSTIVNEIYSE